MTKTHTLGVVSLALLAAAFIFSSAFAFAQTGVSVDAQLEAELNAIAAQVDETTAVEINVNALGTQADISATTDATSELDMEYEALFGDEPAMEDGSMMEDDSMMDASAEASAGVSIAGFFEAVFDFLFGWLK